MLVKINQDGTLTNYLVAKDFGNGRVLVDMGGIYSFADLVQGDEYEFSGEPARPGIEQEVLAELVSHIETTTTVTREDETEPELTSESDPGSVSEEP
jgi:hypothetical protein